MRHFSHWLLVSLVSTHYSDSNLALQDVVESFDDCAFQHIHLLNQYDAYYSFSHPRQSAQCQRSRPRPHGRPSRSASRKHCNRNWYLGVTKKGELRTFQIPSRVGTKLKRSILFIQRWTEDTPSSQSGTRRSDQDPATPRSFLPRAHPGDYTGNVEVTLQPTISALSAESQSVQTTLKRRHAEHFNRKNCSILLRRCSKKAKRNLRQHKASDTVD